MTTPEIRTQVLILVVGLPEVLATEEHLGSEVNRIREFQSTGTQSNAVAVAAFAADAEQAASAIRQHRPALIHFRGFGTENILERKMPTDVLLRHFSGEGFPAGCVILENCYTLAWAEAFAESGTAIVGINGKFTEMLLHRFYARFNVYRPSYELFMDAHWSFFNHHTETATATLAEYPYFITRDYSALASGHAGLDTGVPGYGFGGGLFQRIEPNERAVAYPLFYGTNRKPTDPSDGTKGYSGERDDHVNFGTCTVVVPRSHKIGSLGSPWWKRLLTMSTDGRLQFQWSSLRSLSEETYWEQVRVGMRSLRSKKRMSLVYIHGYNVSFEAAAIRAAQLAVDLKVTGLMSFFSWPSKGTFTGYPADEASIEASEQELTAYLTRLVSIIGNGRVNVIAHSMGNRALLRAMNELFKRAKTRSRIQFGQIFLAAPDVDAKVFRDLAKVYEKLSTRTTLYVSAKDKALASSGIVHDYPRAGFNPPVMIVQGIDTIETSRIDLSFLGHGYFADARDLLSDIHTLLEHDTPPERRFGLEAVTADGLRHWVINRL